MLVALMLVSTAAAQVQVDFYLTPGEFQENLPADYYPQVDWQVDTNELAFEDETRVLNDPLNIDTHALDPDDPWSGPGYDHWPSELNGLTFGSQTVPYFRSVTYRGTNGLAVWCDEKYAEIPVLVSNFANDSFDIHSGVPTRGQHTAMELDLYQFVFDHSLYDVLVTVWIEDWPTSFYTYINVPPWQTSYLGFTVTGSPGFPYPKIESVDIWNQAWGLEGFTRVIAYVPEPATLMLFVAGLISRRRKWGLMDSR